MPQKTFTEKLIRAISIVAILLAIIGIVMISVAQYKSLNALQTPGIIIAAIGFVGYLLKFPYSVFYRRIKTRRDEAMVAVINKEYKLPPDPFVAAVVEKEEKKEPSALDKIKSTIRLHKRLDAVAKQMKKDRAADVKPGQKPNGNIPQKSKKSKRTPIEKRTCPNCGSDMRQNMRGEWICPYCDVDLGIDIAKLRANMEASARRAVEEENAESDAQQTPAPAPAQSHTALASDTTAAVRLAAVAARREQAEKPADDNDKLSSEEMDLFAELEKSISLPPAPTPEPERESPMHENRKITPHRQQRRDAESQTVPEENFITESDEPTETIDPTFYTDSDDEEASPDLDSLLAELAAATPNEETYEDADAIDVPISADFDDADDVSEINPFDELNAFLDDNTKKE